MPPTEQNKNSTSAKTTYLAFIDTETTGLDPLKHEVIEVACIVAEQKIEEGKLSLHVLQSYESKITPLNIEEADPIALTINKYSLDKWKDARPAEEVFKEMASYVNRIVVSETNGQKFNDLILVGHNPLLDILMLWEGFRKWNVPYILNKRIIDLYGLAYSRLALEPGSPRFNALGLLCERYGIVNDRPHTAMGDVKATFEVYKKMFNAEEL